MKRPTDSDKAVSRVSILETQVKHLTNDLYLTREEYQATTKEYFEIYFSLEKNVRKLEERTTQLAESNKRLEGEIAERKRFEKKLGKHQQKLRRLASELSLAEERERRRVASEVHDYIGQNLAFAKIKLNELQTSVSPDSSPNFDEVIELIDRTIRDIRHLVNELSSPVLYELGLVPAIESLARQFRENLFHVTFEDDKKPKPVSDDVKVFLFQAVREFFANVAKHAKAAHCKVSLKVEDDKLRLDIVDDGIGFDTEKMERAGTEAKGFGFFSIRERLELLGGNLEVNSRPEEGTRIILFVPLEQ